jgi:hypothetical protein
VGGEGKRVQDRFADEVLLLSGERRAHLFVQSKRLSDCARMPEHACESAAWPRGRRGYAWRKGALLIQIGEGSSGVGKGHIAGQESSRGVGFAVAPVRWARESKEPVEASR